MFARKTSAALITLVFGLGIILPGVNGVLAGPSRGGGETPSRTPPAEAERKDEKGIRADPVDRADKQSDRVIRLDRASIKKVKSMPGSQRIRVKGAEMTVGEYKTKVLRERRKAVAKFKMSRGRGAAVNLGALQKEFDQKDAARLKSANAKVAAELAKLRQGGSNGNGNGARAAEIKKEAAGIQTRMRGGRATLRDKARAQELLQEYQGLR